MMKKYDKKDMVRVPIHVLKELFEKGHAEFILNGRVIKVKKEDLLFDREEIDTFMEKIKSGEIQRPGFIKGE